MADPSGRPPPSNIAGRDRCGTVLLHASFLSRASLLHSARFMAQQVERQALAGDDARGFDGGNAATGIAISPGNQSIEAC
jgi:hypothetical protein